MRVSIVPSWTGKQKSFFLALIKMGREQYLLRALSRRVSFSSMGKTSNIEETKLFLRGFQWNPRAIGQVFRLPIATLEDKTRANVSI